MHGHLLLVREGVLAMERGGRRTLGSAMSRTRTTVSLPRSGALVYRVGTRATNARPHAETWAYRQAEKVGRSFAPGRAGPMHRLTARRTSSDDASKLDASDVAVRRKRCDATPVGVLRGSRRCAIGPRAQRGVAAPALDAVAWRSGGGHASIVVRRQAKTAYSHSVH